MYNEKVIDHFKHPHNFGEMENPDGIGEVGNMTCGDLMKLYIKVSENEDGEKIIKEVKFQTFGCVAAIATSSVITDLVTGKTIKDAAEITNKQVVDFLGELPPVKIHCSVLAAEALNEAIYNYLSKTKLEIPEMVSLKHERISKINEMMKEKFHPEDYE